MRDSDIANVVREIAARDRIEVEQQEKAQYAANQCGEALGRGGMGSTTVGVPIATNQYVTDNHSLNPLQAQKVETIRAAALQFLNAIDANCPRCADSSSAKRSVRDAMMAANAAIALNGAV